jgi:hypothetical protein
MNLSIQIAAAALLLTTPMSARPAQVFLATTHWLLLHERNKFLAMKRTLAGRSPSRRMK